MRLLLALVSLGCLCANMSFAQTTPTAAQIITQARAKLGTEEKLKSVRTLVFEGKVFDAAGKEEGVVQIQYKAPNKRREYTLRSAGLVEVITGTNGLEGFAKTFNLATKEGTVRVLEAEEIKLFIDLLHADMDFYAVPSKGKVTHLGESTQQGKSCHVLEYQFPGGLIFKRYFDKTTALLVAQEIYGANTPLKQRRTIVEEGEIVVDGIRFPKKTIVYEGDKKVALVEFSTVQVNSDIPDAVFAFPMP